MNAAGVANQLPYSSAVWISAPLLPRTHAVIIKE